MKIFNEKPLLEIRQENEEKQIKMLADLYEGMADMYETITTLTEKTKALDDKIKVLESK